MANRNTTQRPSIKRNGSSPSRLRGHTSRCATGSKGPRRLSIGGKRSASKSSESPADAYATVRRLAPIALGVIALCALVAVLFSTCSHHEIPEGPALPAYITDDMLEAAMDMQDEYGHPAGCTIAQIIQESGAGDTPSALATRDHNLFGMKWSDSFSGAPGVTGPVTWDTNEEYNGVIVGISGTFTGFTDDIACIKFRSSVFLQAERYRTNSLIQEAIETGSSAIMAQGLADAGWATDSSYAQSLIALMDEYDLYRFDKTA